MQKIEANLRSPKDRIRKRTIWFYLMKTSLTNYVNIYDNISIEGIW